MNALRKLYTITFVLLALCLCSAKVFSQQEISYSIGEFKFSGIFGAKMDESDNGIYCLLGNSFFRAERIENVDELVTTWLEKYPDAKLIPVSKTKTNDQTDGFDKFVYSWVVSSSDTLNLHLIRNGAFPGQTMIRSKDAQSKLLISTENYNSFMKRIKEAESKAFEEKKGVWSSFKD